MALTLAKMARGTATIIVPWDDENVTVTYYPGKVNDARIKQLDENLDGLNQALSELLKSWDITEDDEGAVMFPFERMEELPLGFRVDLARAIARDVRPEARAAQTTK